MSILRKPGTIIQVHLPAEAWKPEAERMVVHIKVPDQALFNEIEEHARAQHNNFEMGRRVIGLAVERIENLYLPDGKEFKLDREKSGFLTPECCEWLCCYLQDIVGLVLDMPKLKEIDRKNS